MRKLLVSLVLAVGFAGTGAAPALAEGPPTAPRSPNAFHACVYHGAPGTVGFPQAPFCPV